MGHKQRGYKRDSPEHLLRDYTLFAIACEGAVREPEYFNLFQMMSSKIKVDIISHGIENDGQQGDATARSAPRWVLDRAIKYIESTGLVEEDQLWFVIDTDRWKEDQLRAIADYCRDKPNWNIALSNPCFEVWLYFHKKDDIQISGSGTCADFKREISGFEKGGYHPVKFISNLPPAIKSAKNADSNKGHFLPGAKETKVYMLGEALLDVVGKNAFADYIESRLLIKPGITRRKNNK